MRIWATLESHSIAILIPVSDTWLTECLNSYSPSHQVTWCLWDSLVGGPHIRDQDITHYCVIFKFLTSKIHEYCILLFLLLDVRVVSNITIGILSGCLLLVRCYLPLCGLSFIFLMMAFDTESNFQSFMIHAFGACVWYVVLYLKVNKIFFISF